MPFVFSLLVLAAMVFAVVDIITLDEGRVRHMPKVVWLLLVILLPALGAILWFTLGREYPPRPARSARTTVPVSAAPARDTRSTEQQLADLEREIEEERLRAELRRRRAQGDQRSDG